jgi:PrtD family type I secretion system ABC transporter
MVFNDARRGGNKPGSNPMMVALASCRSAIVALALFSGLINILMLTGSFYMLQVYDRVLLSNSVPTLVMLSIIALVAFTFQGFLDVIRTRIFGRIAERVDLATGPELYSRVVRMQVHRQGAAVEHLQPFRDLEAIRSFMSGTGPVALFDMPWLPIYIIICFFLHPMVGLFALLSALLLVVVAVVSEARSHKPSLIAYEAASRRSMVANASIQGAEAIVSMGMLSNIRRRWDDLNDRHSVLALRANDVTSGLAASSRTLRMVIQSAILGLGAYLVIKGEMTPGTIIAASIISARAIAPVDMAVSSYRSFQVARQGFLRLTALFAQTPEREDLLRLMTPSRGLSAEGIVIVSPSDSRPIIKGVSLRVEAGQGLGIIGHSASGKSTLGRALVGLWHPARGVVAIDGASLRHWDAELLGQHVGYLPHDIQLFDGTIAENISRFEPGAAPEKVLKAARITGCHDQILAMRDGFNTRVGLGGAHLSAGQRQRIGLARALYGDPFLVVLDEPNSNLDADGEAAVTAAIMSVRARGGVVVVIAHRPSAISAVDQLMVLRDGFATAYGRKDDVLREVVTNSGALQSGEPGATRPGGALPRVEPRPANGSAQVTRSENRGENRTDGQPESRPPGSESNIRGVDFGKRPEPGAGDAA